MRKENLDKTELYIIRLFGRATVNKATKRQQRLSYLDVVERYSIQRVLVP